MKKRSTLFLVIMLGLVITACSGKTSNEANNPGSSVPAEIDAAALYKKSCLSCHAVDLSGRVGPDLRDVGTKLNEEQLFNVIHDGLRGMPAYKKRLSTEEIDAMVQWLMNYNQ